MVSVKNVTLLIPEKVDEERDSVALLWEQQGGEVIRLGRFWEPPPIPPHRVRLYGNDTFCLVLAQKFELELVSPPDELISAIPEKFLNRNVEILPLHPLDQHSFPIFIKPVVPKQFRAGVYTNLHELMTEVEGLGADTRIITSEVVHFAAEARSFLLNGEVKACSIYEGSADLKQAIAFVQAMIETVSLPVTCVVDIGLIADRGFGFIEANASWGAGLNGCDPFGVLPCIEAAVKKPA